MRQDRNWFQQDGRDYARFRPDYPAALGAYLADLAPAHERAADIGCGTGQLTLLLADHFAEVIGVDPSEDQLSAAPSHERIHYVCAPAEQLPLADGATDLVAAAQAAHWFDRSAFYREARRIGRDGAMIALISYGFFRFDSPRLHQRITAFHLQELREYWPPERWVLGEGYLRFSFPFDECAAPDLLIEREWNLAEFLGYVSTWSASRHAIAAGRKEILTRFAEELSQLWGDPGRRERLHGPLTIRAGRM